MRLKANGQLMMKGFDLMEFQDFWKQRERMCDAINCHDCIICQERGGRHIIGCLTWISDNPQRAESIIEKWAKEHPPMTNAGKFEEVFGINIDPPFIHFPLDPREVIAINGIRLKDWLKKEYEPPVNKN